MIDAGIFDGDMVIVDKNKSPAPGDIVVAEIDAQYSLKYLEYRNNTPCLVPANSRYPIFYPRDMLSIIGVVVSVLRKYH